MTNAPKDPKRQEIKERIARAQARHEARENGSLTEQAGVRAIEAKDSATEFVKKHPIVAVTGALAVGVLIAGMFKGPRRAAAKGAAKGGAKAAGLAALLSEAAMAFGSHLAESASQAGRAGAHKLDDLGDSMGDTARKLRREASYRAGGVSDSARITSRNGSKALRRAFGRD